MSLLKNPFPWCEDGVVEWPDIWRKSFSMNGFIRLAGLLDALAARDIVRPTDVETLLTDKEQDLGPIYSEPWWDLFPGTSPYPSIEEQNGAFEKHQLTGLKRSTGLIIAKNEPVSFPMAFVALRRAQAGLSRSEGDRALVGEVELQLAIYYIVELDEICAQLSALDEAEVRGASNVSRSLWKQMRMGHPVTRSTAERVRTSILTETAYGRDNEDRIDVASYRSRTDIRDKMEQVVDEKRGKLKMIPAPSEQPRLTRP